jgi:hypothetical protein
LPGPPGKESEKVEARSAHMIALVTTNDRQDFRRRHCKRLADEQRTHVAYHSLVNLVLDHLEIDAREYFRLRNNMLVLAHFLLECGSTVAEESV